jgi:hypothetical protein
MGIGAILQILNLALPAISTLIVAIRGTGGGMSAIIYLDQADANFAADQQQIADWLKAHGKTPAA